MKRAVTLAVKIGVTAALLGWASQQAASHDLLAVAANVDPAFVAAALAVQLAVTLPHAVRWRTMAQRLRIVLSYGASWRLVMIGLFFNQTLPSSLGGDAVRIWILSKVHGYPLNESATSILADRLAALVVIPLFALAGLVVVPEFFAHPEVAAAGWPLMGAVVAGVVVIRRIDLVPARWTVLRNNAVFRQALKASEALRALSRDRRVAGLGLSLSILIQLGIGLAVWLLGRAVGLDVRLEAFLVVTPIVLLIAMIPVTISGWGLRESVMVGAFAYLGGDPALVFATSVLYGLTMIAAGLPGGILWVVQRGSGRRVVAGGIESRDLSGPA